MKKLKKIIAMGLATIAAVSAMSISAMAEENEPVATGSFSNGVTYEVYDISETQIAPMSLSYWSRTVTVNFRNDDGTGGTILGGRNTFVPAPDNKYHVEVGNLPSTMPSVYVGLRLDVDEGEEGNWDYVLLKENQGVDFTIPDSLIYDDWTATASTSESTSAAARFTCYTYSD